MMLVLEKNFRKLVRLTYVIVKTIDMIPFPVVGLRVWVGFVIP